MIFAIGSADIDTGDRADRRTGPGGAGGRIGEAGHGA